MAREPRRMARGPNRGRQRIPLRKIENERARRTTFTKRRKGIYKKASEISTMCGAQVAFFTFSESNNAFSFGSPSVTAVVDKLNTQHRGQIPDQFVQANDAAADELNETLNQVLEEETEVETREKELKVKINEEHDWMGKPLNNLTMEQLKELNDSIENLKIAMGNE